MTDATYKLESAAAPHRSKSAHVSLVFSWGDALRAVALREGQALVVGRADPAQLVIDDRSLSRTHARFSLRDGALQITDLSSTNGVFLNGQRVAEAHASEGDLIALGEVEVRISGNPRTSSDASPALSHAEFMRRLEDELIRAKLFGRSASVVALRELSTRESSWQRALRPVDVAYEYGPKVLLVLRAEAEAQDACTWANTLQKTAGPFAAGIATFPAHAASAEELISVALDTAHGVKPGAPARAAEVGRERPDLAAPIVASPCMQRLYELVARIARTTLPVLVLGETGSGKELVARAVHDKSPRAHAPFKALNCATIPGNLIESVLFGHEKGAFTGADKQTPGVFEQAHGGSVFLDEVGELSAQAQAALLRVLETKRLVRVGGNKEIGVDVRVIAATHRDLAAMVKAGAFREDLMFRLDALTLRVPPLRERREEIGPLAELFLRRAAEQWGAGEKRLSEDALEALQVYSWPGNVRQLKNTLERAVAVSAGDVVALEDLPEQVWSGPEAPAGGAAGASNAVGSFSTSNGSHQAECTFRALPDRVREFEIELIKDALGKARGNQAQAARILGVPRRTLANKVQAYGLAD